MDLRRGGEGGPEAIGAVIGRLERQWQCWRGDPWRESKRAPCETVHEARAVGSECTKSLYYSAQASTIRLVGP